MKPSRIRRLQIPTDRTRVRILVVPTKLLDIILLPVAFFVAGYTGVLLAATNIPVWARNHKLLGSTFLASGFSSGLAAISLCLRLESRSSPKSVEALERVEAVTLAGELVLLLAGVARLGKLGRPLTAGRQGLIFWPVAVAAGVMAPLALHFSKWGRRRTRHPISPYLVLCGSFALRTAMIFAGHESALRPADYFEYAKKRDD